MADTPVDPQLAAYGELVHVQVQLGGGLSGLHKKPLLEHVQVWSLYFLFASAVFARLERLPPNCLAPNTNFSFAEPACRGSSS